MRARDEIGQWSKMRSPGAVIALALCAGGLACSSDADDSAKDGGADAALLGSGGGMSGTAGAPGAMMCNFNPADRRLCASSSFRSKFTELDIYVMFDQSGSMAIKDDGSTMRIDAVRAAVAQFMSDPDSAGIGIGIGYFGKHPLECACTSCQPLDYASAAVAIGALPSNGTNVMASLAAIAPTGETPTGAAVRGACMYAQGWKGGHAGRETVILLVTDGEPKAPLTSMKGGCSPTLTDAVAAAAECAATGIRTYVLGIGPALENLNQIAISGGTQRAYLAKSGGSNEILAALGAIRNDAIPCALPLPNAPVGYMLDIETTTVIHADNMCKMYTNVSRVQGEAACDPTEGGWYYDEPGNPQQIRLCPSTCVRAGDPGAQLSIQADCKGSIVL